MTKEQRLFNADQFVPVPEPEGPAAGQSYGDWYAQHRRTANQKARPYGLPEIRYEVWDPRAERRASMNLPALPDDQRIRAIRAMATDVDQYGRAEERRIGEFELYNPGAGKGFRGRRPNRSGKGAVTLTGNEAEIAYVGVDKEYRRLGIGTHMLKEAQHAFPDVTIRHSKDLSERGERFAQSRPERRVPGAFDHPAIHHRQFTHTQPKLPGMP